MRNLSALAGELMSGMGLGRVKTPVPRKSMRIRIGSVSCHNRSYQRLGPDNVHDDGDLQVVPDDARAPAARRHTQQGSKPEILAAST